MCSISAAPPCIRSLMQLDQWHINDILSYGKESCEANVSLKQAHTKTGKAISIEGISMSSFRIALPVPPAHTHVLYRMCKQYECSVSVSLSARSEISHTCFHLWGPAESSFFNFNFSFTPLEQPEATCHLPNAYFTFAPSDLTRSYGTQSKMRAPGGADKESSISPNLEIKRSNPFRVGRWWL